MLCMRDVCVRKGSRRNSATTEGVAREMGHPVDS